MINELRSITTFVHTAELGSLSKAAEAQQISPQAASKALGQLESYLGVGLVKHLDLRVRQHLSDGSLVRVLAPWCPPFPGFYLYVPSRAQMPAKIRALMDFLIEKRAQLA